MASIYINGVPLCGVDYGSIERYFSPIERQRMQREIMDVEYEDLTETENEDEDERTY